MRGERAEDLSSRESAGCVECRGTGRKTRCTKRSIFRGRRQGTPECSINSSGLCQGATQDSRCSSMVMERRLIWLRPWRAMWVLVAWVGAVSREVLQASRWGRAVARCWLSLITTRGLRVVPETDGNRGGVGLYPNSQQKQFDSN
jgi:hypothetical protein